MEENKNEKQLESPVQSVNQNSDDNKETPALEQVNNTASDVSTQTSESNMVAAPQIEENSTEDNNDDQLIMDDILAQQPLMAALAQAPQEEPSVSGEQESVPQNSAPQTVDETDMQNSIANSALISNGEKTLEEVKAMEANPEVSTPVVTQPVTQPVNSTEHKKIDIGRIIGTILLLAILGAGGYFGYKFLDGKLNRKMVTIEEVTDYFFDKYNIRFKEVNEGYGDIGDKYFTANDNDVEIIIDPKAKDPTKIDFISFNSKTASMDRLKEYALPFYKPFTNYKLMTKCYKLSENYGDVSMYFVDEGNFHLTDIPGDRHIAVGFQEVEHKIEKTKFVDINDSGEIIFKYNKSKIKVKPIKKLGERDAKEIDVHISVDEDKASLNFTTSDGQFTVGKAGGLTPDNFSSEHMTYSENWEERYNEKMKVAGKEATLGSVSYLLVGSPYITWYLFIPAGDDYILVNYSHHSINYNDNLDEELEKSKAQMLSFISYLDNA